MFGEAKERHGLRRCRYIGLRRYRVQAYLTALVVNMKQIVRRLTGVALKDEARVKLKPALA